MDYCLKKEETNAPSMSPINNIQIKQDEREDKNKWR
jgi:hypothetical protein